MLTHVVGLLDCIVQKLDPDVGSVDVAAAGAPPAEQALGAREIVIRDDNIRGVGVELEGTAILVTVLIKDETPLERTELHHRRGIERRRKRLVNRDHLRFRSLGDTYSGQH